MAGRWSSVVSAGNSSTTPLGAGATFTGTAEEVLDFNGIRIFVFASTNSAANGLKLQWSHDGVTFRTADQFKVFGSTLKTFSSPIRARYFRVVYTTASAQSTFHLQTLLGVGSDNTNTVEVESRRLRSSDKAGRIRTTVSQANMSSNTTLYSPYSSGTAFYLETLVYSAYNNDTEQGDFRIRDGSVTVMPFLVAPQALPGSVPSIHGVVTFVEDPMQFLTNLNVLFVASPGLRISMMAYGYEEFI